MSVNPNSLTKEQIAELSAFVHEYVASMDS